MMQGRLAEAAELQVSVLESRTRVLGEDHPATLNAANNLALTYKKQGKLAEAKELQVQVLARRERVLGEDHPDTLKAARNLALTHKK